MKIAVFSDNFYPELSGISDSIITLAATLAKSGHTTAFFAPYYSPKNYRLRNVPIAEPNLGPNIKISRLVSLPYYKGPTKQSRVVIPGIYPFNTLKKFAPDLIHTHLFFGAGLSALLAARRLERPLVGTNHTAFQEFLKYFPVQSEFLKNQVLKYVSWYYNHCQFVSAPSSFILDEMRSYGFTKPTAVISNPVDTVLFTPPTPLEKQALKKKFGFGSHTIIYGGRLSPEKHVDIILRALAVVIKAVPTAEFIILGHGQSLNNLKKLAVELQIQKQTKFIGSVNQTTLSEMFKAADIFTIMGTAETQCLSMMNAFASGIPAIGAAAGGLREYLNSKVGRLVAPGDWRALAIALTELLQNNDLRQALGRNARGYVEQFSSTLVAQKWESVYTKIIAKWRLSRPNL
ncbi:MAG: glycosyltransferase [Candidatus Magasanikbacteria bacterium]|nr:glycosyltransferase [Candidatus Magasanikbacteria bacterium]